MGKDKSKEVSNQFISVQGGAIWICPTFKKGPSLARSRRDPGAQEVDHLPKSVGLAAFDDFERRQAVERGIGRLQPLAERLFLDDFQQGIRQALQFGEPAG